MAKVHVRKLVTTAASKDQLIASVDFLVTTVENNDSMDLALYRELTGF